MLIDTSFVRCIRPSSHETLGRRFGHMRVLLPEIGCASGSFYPEFEQFQQFSFPEFTECENRDPLQRRVHTRSMAMLLNIHAKILTFALKSAQHSSKLP